MSQLPNVPDITTEEGRAAASVQMALNNPQNIPAKFRGEDGSVNVDALAASYVELERRMSGKNVEEAPQAPVNTAVAPHTNPAEALGEAPAAAAPDNPVDDLASALGDPAPNTDSGAGVDWDAVGNEFSQSGSLSDATMAALKKAGVPDIMVQAAVNGFKAQQANSARKAADMVGGDANLQATIQWAKDNLPPQERLQIVDQLRGPAAETVLLGLYHRMQAAKPQPEGQSLVDTSVGEGSAFAPNAASVKPYSNYAEMEADMNKPEYQYDPAFQQHVAARCAAAKGMDPRRFQ